MARLSQYPKDTTPDKLDSFLTLDSTTGNTTRIDISDIASVVANQNLLETSDSALFHYTTPNNLDYTTNSPGLIITNPVGDNATRLLSTLTQLYVAKSGVNQKNISTYLTDLLGYQIKISALGDLNVFGIFEVTAVENYESDYIKLSLSYTGRGSGNLVYGQKYYISHHQTSFDRDFSDNSVTEFGDVYNAGSGYIITPNERSRVNEVTSKIFYSDIINDLESNRPDRPLSAAQGLILKQYVDAINTLLLSDETNLDTLQEIVNFIETNKDTLQSLTIGSVAGLQTALDSKVDKVSGKQLSENDFTSLLLQKLNGIQTAAEVNVNADWTQASDLDDSFIQNKPTDVTDLSLHSVVELNDISSVGSGSIITDGERQRITGLADTPDNKIETLADLQVSSVLHFANPQETEPTEDNAIYFTNNGTHDTLQFKSHGHRVSLDAIVDNLSTGLCSGGLLSISGSNSFTISAGKAVIIQGNKEFFALDPHPIVKHISWASQTILIEGLDVLNASQKQNFIFVDVDGNVNQQSTPFTDSQYNTQIPIGAALHSSGIALDARNFPRTAYSQGNQFLEFARIFGPMKKSGHEITGVAGTLSLSRSSGISFALGRNYAIDPNNPSFIQDASQGICTMHRYYRDGSGDFVRDTNNGAGYTTLDVDQLDNGSGTLEAVKNNKFTTQRIYYFPNNPTILISYYGRNEYATLDAANTNINSEPFTESANTASQAIFLGYVISEKGVTDLSSTTNVRILTSGIFRSVAYSSTGAAASAANLSDLADTTIQTPQGGELLNYDNTTQTWKNFTPEYNSNAIAYAIALGG